MVVPSDVSNTINTIIYFINPGFVVDNYIKNEVEVNNGMNIDGFYINNEVVVVFHVSIYPLFNYGVFHLSNICNILLYF